MRGEAQFIENRLESYVEAMSEASNIFVEESPDFILAPMNGSVPFIDAMTIVNPDFDPSKVVYMPASSRIDDVLEVISSWYYNFLEEVAKNPLELPKIIGIDEVVSGNSAVRCIKRIDLAAGRKRKKELQSIVERLTSGNADIAKGAVNDIDHMFDYAHASEMGRIRRNLTNGSYDHLTDEAGRDLHFCIALARRHLEEGLVYKTIGIEDSKYPDRHKEYEGMKEDGRVIPVGVRTIISMDQPDFYPPRFKELEDLDHPYLKFSPLVKNFQVTPRYLQFLGSIANVVGKNPSGVNPVNMHQILDSRKYLSREYLESNVGSND